MSPPQEEESGRNCFSEGLRSDDELLAGFQVACRYRFAAIPSVVGTCFGTSGLAAGLVILSQPMDMLYVPPGRYPRWPRV